MHKLNTARPMRLLLPEAQSPVSSGQVAVVHPSGSKKDIAKDAISATSLEVIRKLFLFFVGTRQIRLTLHAASSAPVVPFTVADYGRAAALQLNLGFSGFRAPMGAAGITPSQHSFSELAATLPVLLDPLRSAALTPQLHITAQARRASGGPSTYGVAVTNEYLTFHSASVVDSQRTHVRPKGSHTAGQQPREAAGASLRWLRHARFTHASQERYFDSSASYYRSSKTG
jgi:hypothetical protein